MLSTTFACILAWESCDAAASVDNECLSLSLTSHKDVHVEVLQVGAVTIQGTRLEVSVKQYAISRGRVTRHRFLQIGISKLKPM